MRVSTRQLLYGMATFLPGLSRFHAKGTGGMTARYCYAVWMRHLVMAGRNGLLTAPPRAVGELGPGDTVGIGLAALLSGANTYYGLDVVRHASLGESAPLLDQLVGLFAERARIPDDAEFPWVRPGLASYDFPREMLTDERLAQSLAPGQVARIRRSLEEPDVPASVIRYVVPWDRARTLCGESLDMIYSQAVLEHVDDLSGTYQAMRRWLAPGGLFSHQIDFRSHGLTPDWNGHWALGDRTWRLLRGRRSYLLNRQPHSVHLRLLAESGFRVLADETVRMPSRLRRGQLASPFREMAEDDLAIGATFVQGVAGP